MVTVAININGMCEMEKYIKNLNIRNIGKYSEAKVKFNRKFNFLVGQMDVEKPLLLRALLLF